MSHFVYRGVNHAFRDLVNYVNEFGEENDYVFSKAYSRNGDVIRFKRPVIFEYERPTERVLFNQARDTSPFFHCYEALWMLAGRNDLKSLQYYVSTFGNYSDNGKVLNGAYGYRWRNARVGGGYLAGEYVDQLEILIDHLKDDLTSRRAVLDMWTVKDDLLKIGKISTCEKCEGKGSYAPTTNEINGLPKDKLRSCELCGGKGKRLTNQSKDTCCNLSIVFEIESFPFMREEAKRQGLSYRKGADSNSLPDVETLVDKLNMTVYNRSNDMILGALGANFVHFTILQEYMAACIGVEVGTYCQVSNNMHCYTDPKLWKPEEWLADDTPDYYTLDGVRAGITPLVKDPTVFDKEVTEFVERHGKDAIAGKYTEPFLQNVAQPMCLSFHCHKRREYKEAFHHADQVESHDWRLACKNWIEKRRVNWEAKLKGGE